MGKVISCFLVLLTAAFLLPPMYLFVMWVFTGATVSQSVMDRMVYSFSAGFVLFPFTGLFIAWAKPFGRQK